MQDCNNQEAAAAAYGMHAAILTCDRCLPIWCRSLYLLLAYRMQVLEAGATTCEQCYMLIEWPAGTLAKLHRPQQRVA